MVVVESVLAASLSAFIMSQIAQAHARKMGKTKEEELHQEATEIESDKVEICQTEQKERDSAGERSTGKPAIIKDSTGQVRRAIVFEDLIEFSSLTSTNMTRELSIDGKESIVGSPNSTRQARLAIVFDEFVDPTLFPSHNLNGSNVNIELAA
jgi:hypothetical protein